MNKPDILISETLNNYVYNWLNVNVSEEEIKDALLENHHQLIEYGDRITKLYIS